MKPTSSKLVAILLLACVFIGGGLIGVVLGQRRAASKASEASSVDRVPARLDRFEKRLGLSAEQRAAVEAQLRATREEVTSARARGQEGILAILDEDQKVLYKQMLERQNERRARKRGKRGKRGKRNGKRRRDNR